MTRRALTTCALALAAWNVVSVAWASDVPPYLSHQGVLTDTSGVVVADGLYTLQFEIFDAASGGTALFCQELQVQVTGGLYNVLLSDSGGCGPGTLAAAFQNPNTYLQLTITGVPAGSHISPPEALEPRQKFASVPYAMVAPQIPGTRVFLGGYDANNDPVVDLSIPAGYDRFEFELVDIYPAQEGVYLYVQVSTNGGTSFFESGDYEWVVYNVRNGGAGRTGENTGDKISLVYTGPNDDLTTGPGEAYNGTVTILSPGGAGSFFTLRVSAVHFTADVGSNGEVLLTDGAGQLLSSTERVDVVRFRMSSGNVMSGRFRLYALP